MSKRSFSQHTVAFLQRIISSAPKPDVYEYVNRFVVVPVTRVVQTIQSIWNETAHVAEEVSPSSKSATSSGETEEESKDAMFRTIGEMRHLQWGQYDELNNEDSDAKYGRTLGAWPGSFYNVGDEQKSTSCSSSLQPLMATGTDQLCPLETRGTTTYMRTWKQHDPITRPVFRMTDSEAKDCFNKEILPQLDGLEGILAESLFKQDDPEGPEVNKAHYSCIKPFPTAAAATHDEEKAPATMAVVA